MLLRHLACGVVVLEACSAWDGARTTSGPLRAPASLATSRIAPPKTADAVVSVDARSPGTSEAEPGEAAIYEDGHFVAASRIRDVIGEGLAKRVLDATFSRYLTEECPKIPAVELARGWVDLDRLQAETSARGLFRPKIVQRVDGHFTAPNLDETLFNIEKGPCVNNGAYNPMQVIFDTAMVENPNNQLEPRDAPLRRAPFCRRCRSRRP